MNFSFFMMPLHVPGDSPSLAFQRDIELIAYVDRLGFDEFWIGEHHSAGWETMPAPEMALAKASATAPRIKLGTSVISLPFHHPFHVAERMAFLDHLTEGRAILGVGQSNLRPDVKLFNIPPARPETDDVRIHRRHRQITRIPRPPLISRPLLDHQRHGPSNCAHSSSQDCPSAWPPQARAAASKLAGKYNMILLSPVGRTPPGGAPLGERWQIYEQAALRHGHTPKAGKLPSRRMVPPRRHTAAGVGRRARKPP